MTKSVEASVRKAPPTPEQIARSLGPIPDHVLREVADILRAPQPQREQRTG